MYIQYLYTVQKKRLSFLLVLIMWPRANHIGHIIAVLNIMHTFCALIVNVHFSVAYLQELSLSIIISMAILDFCNLLYPSHLVALLFSLWWLCQLPNAWTQLNVCLSGHLTSPLEVYLYGLINEPPHFSLPRSYGEYLGFDYTRTHNHRSGRYCRKRFKKGF